MHGDACFPFHFEWPRCTGPSMIITQSPNLKGEPCGIKHFIEVFCLYRGSFQPHKRFVIGFLNLKKQTNKILWCNTKLILTDATGVALTSTWI